MQMLTEVKILGIFKLKQSYRVYKPKRHLFNLLILGNLLLAYNFARYLKWKLHLLTLNHIFIIFLWGQP